MANLQETAQWETGIYQLETSDPVMGGADGIDNRQAKQLGNRTLWLKNELEQMSRTIPDAVTKSDAVNSNSSSTVATSKAVKTAYDKAVAAKEAADEAVKTSGNQDIGGNKTFTAAATFKKGAIVADSVADFAANQYLQIGANNVNTYLHNKRSGKYLSMRNDGELRYDGKRVLNTDDLSGMMPVSNKIGGFDIIKFPDGTMIQTYSVNIGDNRGSQGVEEYQFTWAVAFVSRPAVSYAVRSNAANAHYAFWVSESHDATGSLHKFRVMEGIRILQDATVILTAIGRWK